MRLKMEFYVNVQLLKTSKFFTKENKGIINCGVRNSTFYFDGNPSKIVSRSEIKEVFAIKDLSYVGVSPDTFINIYRSANKVFAN